MMHRLRKAAVAAAVGILLAASSGHAAEIDVPFNFTLSGFGFSSPYRAQTFVALAPGFGDELTVYVGPTSDLNFKFRALITEVAAGPGFHPTNVLFESGPLLVPLFCFCTQTFAVDLGGLELVPGQAYAVVLDHFVESTGAFMSANVGIRSPRAYFDGAFYNWIPSPFPLTGTRAEHFASNGWFLDDRVDMAFKLTFAEPPQPVAVDVLPRGCPNPLPVASNGLLPAAILGSAEVDVSTIDVASLRLEGVAPARSAVEDVATPFEPATGKEGALDCNDLGADGFADLTLKFDRQQVIAALGGAIVDGEAVILHLTGSFSSDVGGDDLRGEDVVVIEMPPAAH